MRIYIKGFKSIADGQYVGIGKKITFLAGPNSAGKSVLLHALQKLKGTSPLFQPEDHLIHHNIFNDKVATSQSLGIEWKNGEDSIQFRATMFDGDHFTSHGDNIDDIFSEKLTYQSIEETGSSTIENKTWCISRMINNQNVTHELQSTTRTTQNQTPNFLNEKSRKQPTSPIKEAIQINYRNTWNGVLINYTNQPENIKIKIKKISEWVKDLIFIQDEPALYGDHLKAINDAEQSSLIYWEPTVLAILIKKLKGSSRQHHLNQFNHHRAFIIKLALEIDKKFSPQYPGNNLNVALVSADRILPSESDLKAHLKPGTPIQNPYHELIKSLVAQEWGADLGVGTPTITNYQSRHPTTNYIDITALAKNLNSHLSDGLFIDNGYQVRIKSSIRLSKSEINTEANPRKIGTGKHSPNEIIKAFEFDAQMYIIDSFGRELDFDRIGSGIGYVFPVLIECFKYQNSAGIVFLQQPELHLHPALQASLCDVLIESASDRMIIAETHSEHLMLRALKRIRQTFNGTLLNKELELGPDDVAINYFEPMPDGTTRVHEIRIAPDGEFIDKWPNGFFPERDQELFDE